MIDPVRITSPIDMWLLDVGIRCGMLNCTLVVACVAMLIGYAIGRRHSSHPTGCRLYPPAKNPPPPAPPCVRRAFAVIEAVVSLAILVVLVALLWSAFFGGSPRHAATEPPVSWNLYTAQHDGHWFVKDAGGGVCHHPDCPCQTRKVEVER